MGPVAIFPLGTVLLPAMPLPLRIFEERYRVMLGRLLDEEEPEFGVVTLADDAGGEPSRQGVGTMARIARVTPGESDLNVMAIGGSRFRVTEWLPDDPYPRALIELLPTLPFKEELRPLLGEVEGTVRRVLARAAEYADTPWNAGIELSEDPVAAAWQLAGIAPLGLADKQSLLACTTLGELLRRTLDLVIAAEPHLTAAAPPDDVDAAIEELLRGDPGPGPA